MTIEIQTVEQLGDYLKERDLQVKRAIFLLGWWCVTIGRGGDEVHSQDATLTGAIRWAVVSWEKWHEHKHAGKQ